MVLGNQNEQKKKLGKRVQTMQKQGHEAKSVVNTCNNSVGVLVKFIAVLFRALQKLGILAAKIFELIDEIYSHLCLISCSCLS